MKNLTLSAVFLMLLILVSQSASAEWIVTPKILGNYDGDTVSAEVAIFPNAFVRGSFRIIGVDTPEMRGGCEESKKLAQQATLFTREALKGDVSFVVADKMTYGRWLAVVYVDGKRLDKMLIDAGLGRYMGSSDKRKGWCDG